MSLLWAFCMRPRAVLLFYTALPGTDQGLQSLIIFVMIYNISKNVRTIPEVVCDLLCLLQLCWSLSPNVGDVLRRALRWSRSACRPPRRPCTPASPVRFQALEKRDTVSSEWSCSMLAGQRNLWTAPSSPQSFGITLSTSERPRWISWLMTCVGVRTITETWLLITWFVPRVPTGARTPARYLQTPGRFSAAAWTLDAAPLPHRATPEARWCAPWQRGSFCLELSAGATAALKSSGPACTQKSPTTTSG